MEERQEQNPIRTKVMVSLVLILLGALMIGLSKLVLTPEYENLQASLGETATIARKIASVREQEENYKILRDASGKVYGNLVTERDGYISFIGEITMANKLNINKLTVDDIVPMGNQMYSMQVKIELQGELYNVKNFVQQLYDSEIVGRINSFSYRLQSGKQELLWMWRSIDNVTLIPWWELTESDAVPSTSDAPDEPLTANDLLSHGTALCYLEIEFLGTGGQP